jgi:hypothetical protein
MAQTPEGRVKDAIKKVLNENDIWYFMPAANGFGKVGVPDFICCWRGKFLAIEAKAKGKRECTTANQNIRIEEIRSARGWALVVDDVEQLKEFINEQRR